MGKMKKDRTKINQETSLNIVDWLLAIDFDAGQTGGGLKV